MNVETQKCEQGRDRQDWSTKALGALVLGSIGLAGVGFISELRKDPIEEVAGVQRIDGVLPAGLAVHLGNVDGNSFNLTEMDGHLLLTVESAWGVEMVEHRPSPEDWAPGRPHTFEVLKDPTQQGLRELFCCNIDGVRYGILTSPEGSAITRLSLDVDVAVR